ncbi:MAG: hypothetical protein NT159_22095 [Proteobacteria bacterium]|nr:hypothetical protein [Pseudomonadota bacterium]
MLRRLPRQIILTLCAVFLLGAQQAALAHLIGHLGLAGQATAHLADAADHADALSLSHLCTSCLAISALAAGAPPPVSFPAVAVAVARISAGFEIRHPLISTAPPYAARAPPISL